MFGYSQAVRVGPWVMVSGQVGFDSKTRGFPPDLKKQVELSFSNLEAVLKLSGASLSDVVEITTYQLDMTRFDDVVTIHNDVFGDHRPAWSAIGVSALALPDIQFEVSALAYAPKGRSKPAAEPEAADAGKAPAAK
ncbi:MAG: RidA family protein [Nevskia sp.]|nr:RidA family protein [Nevskia sp.]